MSGPEFPNFNESLFWRKHAGSFPLSVHYFEKLASTNTWLIEHVTEMVLPALCIADFQTGGRGTYGRSWISEPCKNLTFSVALKLPAGISAYAITLCMMLAWKETLADFAGLGVMLKWPNDLYTENRKLGGVLSESISRNGTTFLVTGMGINVNQERFEPESAASGTSVSIETGSFFEREALLAAWCFTVEKHLSEWMENPAVQFVNASSAFIHTGKTVRYNEKSAVFKGISPSGFPELLLQDGRMEICTDSTVRFRHD